MFLKRSTTKILPAVSVLGCTCLIGCANNGEWNQPAQRNQPKPRQTASRPEVEPSHFKKEDTELKMFGRDANANDLVFEGKAAVNLRQHTMPSEGSDFDPDVDSTGKLLVYASTRHSKNSHLYIKSTNGATITQITDGKGDDAQPTFSPDGKKIAFASDRAGQWDVWVIDADGRNLVQLTNSPMPELHPSWAPDGKRLVYCRINPKENRGELWIAELDNPGMRRFIGEGLFPAWSPKGDKIAYQRAKARGSRWFSIWTVDLRGEEVLFPTEIAGNEQAALITPSWSKDGTQLAFSVLDGDPDAKQPNLMPCDSPQTRADIGVVEVDGRGMQRITEGRGRHFSPVWSSDGCVFFSCKEEGTETIWSVKPFRPGMFSEPPSATTTSNRRAAQAADEEVGQ